MLHTQHRPVDDKGKTPLKRDLSYLHPLDAKLAQTFGDDGKDEELASDTRSRALSLSLSLSHASALFLSLSAHQLSVW